MLVKILNITPTSNPKLSVIILYFNGKCWNQTSEFLLRAFSKESKIMLDHLQPLNYQI